MISLMPRVSTKRAVVPKQIPGGFEQHATKVLTSLQSEMAALIRSIPAAGRLERATDLQRVLGIHSKMAWQTFRVATAENAIEEGRAVPGPQAMGRFLEAAAKRGVPAEQIAAVKEAFERFEELVRVHAGNRLAFDSMIGGLASDGADQLDMVHKRAAFRAYAHFLGARARAMLGCTVYQPSAKTPDLLEWVNLKGLFGLSTQRRDGAWELSSLKGEDEIRALNEKDRGLTGQERDPVGTTKSLEGIALFKEFCSSPLPPLKAVSREAGRVSVLVDGQLIDNAAAIDLVLGPMKHAGVPRFRSKDGGEDSVLLTSIAVRTPSEVLIHDVLVHKDVFGPATPRVEVYHTLAGGPFARFQPEHDRLTVRESVMLIGRGAEAVACPEIPRYPQMLKAAMAKVGWNPSVFDVYRCRVEYPVVPSTVRVVFDLPEKT